MEEEKKNYCKTLHIGKFQAAKILFVFGLIYIFNISLNNRKKLAYPMRDRGRKVMRPYSKKNNH